MTGLPGREEAADYYWTYISQVGDGDIRDILDAQVSTTIALFNGISESQSLHRYAPGKWSIREVLGHVNDAERVFAFRAWWFARGFATPLPSFDQDVAVAAANSDQRSWASHIAEFQSVRAATSALFRGLAPDAWSRRGIASDNPFTVRALAYITAGHLNHHLRILKASYLERA
jgi:hypothetical protein